MDRKSFLQTTGFAVAGFFGAVFGSLRRETSSAEICAPGNNITNRSAFNSGVVTTPEANSYQNSVSSGGSLRGTNSYGSMAHPPFFIKEEYTNRFYFPPNFRNSNSKNKEFNLNIFPLSVNIAHNINYPAWTFDGVVPGPILRANLGDKLKINVKNSSPDPHSLHFHGNHDPKEDGWEPIPSFGEKTYYLEADPIGLHPYHCHVPPLMIHTAKGLYGGLIVDPLQKRAPAHEFVLTFSSWDTKGVGVNDFYTWNGVSGIYDRYPMKVPVGERVRFYIQNMMEREPVMTFHLHAKTFDIIRNLGSIKPDGHSDVVTLGQTERVVIEFTLTKKGRYMFHPHQTHMAENGGMGWIVAV
jgi:FtsP/CotA-like multicopper oxidase with cupredoxin domain